MQTILISYFFAAICATGLTVAAGLWTRHVRARETWIAPHGVPVEDPLLSRVPAELRTCALLAVKRLLQAMQIHGVRMDVAIESGLLVRMSGAALTDLLEEILAAAVHHAPYGRVLLTATPSGAQVSVAITDDAAGADPAERRASLRSLTERVALRGIVLDVDVRPADGTALILRLPVATATVPHDQAAADTIPASQSTPIGSREIVDG